MKQYLLDYFTYNDSANRKILSAIDLMPNKDEAVKLFSHIITAQNKWLNRITKSYDDQSLAWWSPVYENFQLLDKWEESYNNWLRYLNTIDDSTIEQEVTYYRSGDGKGFRNKIREIAFQVNCHSVHHRAQIAMLIRKQGLTPPITDYIFGVTKEI